MHVCVAIAPCCGGSPPPPSVLCKRAPLPPQRVGEQEVGGCPRPLVPDGQRPALGDGLCGEAHRVRVLALCQPQCRVLVHGERVVLAALARLAEELGEEEHGRGVCE